MTRSFIRLVPVFGLALALTASAAFAQAAGQERPSPSPSEQAKPAEQTARGELASIDVTTKILTIKPTAGAEQRFQYDDNTRVTGARGGVAGLATQNGKQVVVHFKNEGSTRVATEIEIQADEKK